jgi:diaminopimelate decarboxylase
MAYPDATLVGVDYLSRSSGIHSPDLDDVWIQRPWNDIDLAEYARQIRELLDRGAFWISTLDLEIWWLGRALHAHPNLLAPSLEALRGTRKPAVQAFSALPCRIAPFVSTHAPDWDLHTFGRKYGWRVWLKGPYYDAKLVTNWSDFQWARDEFQETWSTSELFLQASVTGYEESISFSAHHGRLLDAVYMQKRDITREGKTWGGQIDHLPDGFEPALREVVSALGWTGGGELEMIRDNANEFWLMECNPRFPAWIHGATMCGRNLPAALVEASSGMAATPAEARSHQFARIVLEMPVREGYPLPPIPEPRSGALGPAGKYPSGMPALAARLLGRGDPVTHGPAKDPPIHIPEAPPRIPSVLGRDVANADVASGLTPTWLFLASTAEDNFEKAARLAQAASLPDCTVTIAYSIKTNPDERFLSLARSHGFYAEAISKLELKKALTFGFGSERIILNGPGKWWPETVSLEEPIQAVFCDSVEELQRLVKRGAGAASRPAHVLGVRLRAPHIESRFGTSVSSPTEFAHLVACVSRIPEETSFGCHFHFPSSAVGVEQWWSLYHSMLRWGLALESSSGKPVRWLDVGGGWFPDDFYSEFSERLGEAVSSAKRMLRGLTHLVLEPGKALVQPAMALAVRVLDVRRPSARREPSAVVVDGSLAELPVSHLYPHRILLREPFNGLWKPLGKGHGKILGRICMEDDVLASGVGLPKGVRPGDIMTICDVGAYDRSMAYEFGRG